MNGLVLINKPVGVRSTQCVAVVRKYIGGEKAGHAGTLDSTASGLLVLLTGKATRFSEYVMSLPKVYRVIIQFGIETDTCDYSGEITSEKGWADLNQEALNDSLFSFLGWRTQSPPPISAVKINGVPAHRLARSGQELDMKKRPVFFRKIDIFSPYDSSNGTLGLEVHCGRGTYIRSLASDLGKILGCGAHVKFLERVSIGKMNLSKADKIDSEDFGVLPLSELASNFTHIFVSQKDSKSFTNGMSILLSHAEKISRGVNLMNGSLCVEGENFLGFGTYAGYDYVRPVVIVPKE